MKVKTHLPQIDLQLFAEGGDAAGGATDTAGAQDGAVTGESASDAVKRGRKGDPVTDDTTDSQGAAQQQDDTAGEESTQDRTQAYAEFKSKYKDLYDAEVQGIVQNRLKKSKEAESKLKAVDPIINMLSQKYGVDAQNVEALNSAIENDDAYYEQESLETGIPVPQLKQIKKMERENAELRQTMQEQQRRESANKLYSQWMSESKELQKLYPAFDLETELKNERFLGLLKVPGVDVKTAFELIHKDEILPAAMQYTAKQVEQKLANNMRSKTRPAENGSSSSAGAVTKIDPAKMTKAQRDEIAQRAMRGEKIKF